MFVNYERIWVKCPSEWHASVLLSSPATVLSCFPPLQPCSLHPIHRITRDAGVSIATAVQAVAIGLWWGLVAVMCVHECMCGCLRVFASEKDMEREERQKKKKKNTWELVSIFTTETRLTAHSSWPFAHRACTHTHTVTIPTGGKKCSEKELSLTVCKWWTKPYGLCSSAVAFSLLVRSCAATIHCCSLPCDQWWHYYSPGLSWKMCGVNHLSKQAVCRQRGVLAGTIPILKTLSEHTGN